MTILWVSIGFFALGVLALGMAVVALLHTTDLIATLMQESRERQQILGNVIAKMRDLSQWRN